MRFIAKLHLVMAMLLSLLAAMPARAAPAPCPDGPSLAAEAFPDDICRSSPPNHEAFATLAWRAFKMLVWPAMLDKGSRGEPDEERNLAARSGPRVFETYKSDWETFSADPATRVDWDRYPPDIAACRNASTMPDLPRGALVLASVRKFDSVVTQPDSGRSGVGRRLMAQNGSLVRYLAGFDRNAFTLIQTNYDHYKSADSPTSEDAPVATAPVGTIIVKSAWIELTGSSDASRFYVRDDAWIQNPETGDCEPTKRVGLVGLHIALKTALRPQWTWASFEQVDNVPAPGDAARRRYTFHNGVGIGSGTPANAPMPYNVERLSDIAPAVETVNQAWRGALRDSGIVWANYRLVVVQWARIPQIETGNMFGGNSFMPEPPCGEANPHTNMANVAMETHVQSKPTCGIDNLEARRTCMGCHVRARNYDFIFAIPNNIAGASNAGVSRARASVTSILRKNIEAIDR